MEEKQGLILGVDGRADSPGHSAKYGSYSIIDLNKNKFKACSGNSNHYTCTYNYLLLLLLLLCNYIFIILFK